MEALDSVEPGSIVAQYGPVFLFPPQSGIPSFKRSGHGWATTAGVIDASGNLRPTFDREGERMVAAETPTGIDFSELLPRGFMNDSHRSLPDTTHQCSCPDKGCPLHGSKQLSVLIGIPDALEYVGAKHALAERDGKIGWYSHFHLIDPQDANSWKNSDGTPRMRMLRDGTVTEQEFSPTHQEFERANAIWELGLKLQRDGRTLGQSIQGREFAIPCPGGKAIVRAKAHQIALIEYPHNPDATVEGLGGEMAKGDARSAARQESQIVMVTAGRIYQMRQRYNVATFPQAIAVAKEVLTRRGICRSF